MILEWRGNPYHIKWFLPLSNFHFIRQSQAWHEAQQVTSDSFKVSTEQKQFVLLREVICYAFAFFYNGFLFNSVVSIFFIILLDFCVLIVASAEIAIDERRCGVLIKNRFRLRIFRLRILWSQLNAVLHFGRFSTCPLLGEELGKFSASWLQRCYSNWFQDTPPWGSSRS